MSSLESCTRPGGGRTLSSMRSHGPAATLTSRLTHSHSPEHHHQLVSKVGQAHSPPPGGPQATRGLAGVTSASLGSSAAAEQGSPATRRPGLVPLCYQPRTHPASGRFPTCAPTSPLPFPRLHLRDPALPLTRSPAPLISHAARRAHCAVLHDQVRDQPGCPVTRHKRGLGAWSGPQVSDQ